MKRVVFAGLFCIVGCTATDLFAPFIVPPEETQPVVGGLADLRPYIGRLQLCENVPIDRGLFMLASCGCGNWRVLFQPNDGSKQVQFPIAFFTNGEYQTTGEVAVYGLEEAKQIGFSGRVNQDAGTITGKAMSGLFRAHASAARGDGHAQPVDACILCHLGDDPVFPLPDTHPDRYKTNPRVCLDCHSANGM
jgi:hypothetical protein